MLLSGDKALFSCLINAKESQDKIYKLVVSVDFWSVIYFMVRLVDGTRYSIIICELDKKVLTFEGTLENLYSIPSESSNVHILASDSESLFY